MKKLPVFLMFGLLTLAVVGLIHIFLVAMLFGPPLYKVAILLVTAACLYIINFSNTRVTYAN